MLQEITNEMDHWLSWLEKLHHKPIDLGLDRVSRVAKQLHILPFKHPVITIAGTNGKGSTVALLETIFTAAGYRVGAYYSPHLMKYNERVHLYGKECSDPLLCQAFEKVETVRDDITLTYFEFGTLAALWLFQQQELDVTLLEVGLGGRLDAVNIVPPDISVITSIAIDHTEWLGPDREAIGSEKAGIFRKNKPAICGDPDPPQSVLQYAQHINAPLYVQNKDFLFKRETEYWEWRSATQQLVNLPAPQVDIQNASTVLMVLELFANQLPVSREAIFTGLLNAALPGRIQRIAGQITRIFDVAHNPAASVLLAQCLRKEPCQGITRAVFAMLNDKDIISTVKPLKDLIECWYVADLTGLRGTSAKQMSEALRSIHIDRVTEYSSPQIAYLQAMEDAAVGDRIVVFGSFHTVAPILKCEV